MNLLDVLNAEQYVMLKNEALANAGTPANGTTRGFYNKQVPMAILSTQIGTITFIRPANRRVTR